MSLHRAAYEEVYGKPYEIDERDREILAERIEKWNSRQDGPRVGDFVITQRGMLRFTHDWGDDIQTTVRPGYDSSFYLSGSGHMSFSGSLDPGVLKTDLELTNEVQEGSCWFFSHGFAEAHNGVYVTVPCRVYRLKTC